MAAQGLLAAPLCPVLSRRVLRALWGGRVAASAHIMEGHKGPCDTLPRAIQSAVPIAWRVTKGPVAHCHVPVPWGLPHPSKPAPQRHSAKGALAVPAKEAPWTPQQSSQQHTGRKQRAVLAPIPAPTALPKWVQHRASCAAPPLSVSGRGSIFTWGRGSFLTPGADVPLGCCTWVPRVFRSGLLSLSGPTCTKRVAAGHGGLLAVALGAGRRQSSGRHGAV